MISKADLLLACRLAIHGYTPDFPVPEGVRRVRTVLCQLGSLQASLYLDEGQPRMYCVVDGTSNLLTLNGVVDMLRNVGVAKRGWLGARVHWGYALAAEAVSEAVGHMIEEAASRGLPLVFVGHSAGGAIAHLLAIAYEAGAVTFGQPRVGSRRSLNAVSHRMKQYVRVQNASDLVPRQPSFFLNYGHQTVGCDHVYLPLMLQDNHLMNPPFTFMLYDRAFLPLGRRLHHHRATEYRLAIEAQYVDPATPSS